jgi:hypothetical protein
LGTVSHAGSLSAGGSYTASGQFRLPATIATGSYYFVVEADAQGLVTQVDRDHVVASSAQDAVTGTATTGAVPQLGVPVVVAAPTDIAVTQVLAPPEVVSGQTFSVSWTLSNTGGATSGVWYDEIYLSRDQVLDSSVIALGSYRHDSSIPSGASNGFSTSLTIPDGISGP